MTRLLALAIVAALQLAFIVLTLALLFTARVRGKRTRTRDEDADIAIAPSLRAVMLGDDGGEALAAALSRLRPNIAVRELLSIGGSRLSLEQRQRLAVLVRHSPWVEGTLRKSSSRRWWNRMDAARLLAMVCDETDEMLLARLVTDPHPAVASAATAAIPRCAGVALVEAVVAGLPARSSAVRLQQSNALRSHAGVATPMVVARLSRPATPDQLRAWVQLAEILGTPEALAAVVPLASHPDVDVRTSTARALRACFTQEAVEACAVLLRDQDWRVRAAAARAVGALNVANAIPLLSEAMGDESWWVRFRAALALADLSEEGRAALAAARHSADPYARDMAILVGGLSPGSRLELTAG